MIEDLTPQETDLAQRMGAHLRAGRRLRFPRDTQDDFARRIGVSRYTYQKMEQGHPGVALGSYLAAAVRLGIGRQFADGLAPPSRSFFDDT